MLEVALNGIYWYNCIDKSKKHKGNLWMIAVVPRAGTWIETNVGQPVPYVTYLSFPVRERGLKLRYPRSEGVGRRRSPCGNVD